MGGKKSIKNHVLSTYNAGAPEKAAKSKAAKRKKLNKNTRRVSAVKPSMHTRSQTKSLQNTRRVSAVKPSMHTRSQTKKLQNTTRRQSAISNQPDKPEIKINNFFIENDGKEQEVHEKIINDTKFCAEHIIEIINIFLKEFHIIKEFYKIDDTYIIYLYVMHEEEKIYFYRSSFSIVNTDDDIDYFTDIFTKRSSKRQFESLIEHLRENDEVKRVYIHTTQCIANGFNSAIIIQSYIMAKVALLQNVFLAEKEDMTDRAVSGSTSNFNHFLGFFNKGGLELTYDEKDNERIRALDADGTKYAFIPESLHYISKNLHKKIHNNKEQVQLIKSNRSSSTHKIFSNYVETEVSKYNEYLRNNPRSSWPFTPPKTVEGSPIDEITFWE